MENAEYDCFSRRRLARPSSARPAPPRIKKNEAQVEEQHIVSVIALLTLLLGSSIPKLMHRNWIYYIYF